jgi:hypothetical protein
VRGRDEDGACYAAGPEGDETGHARAGVHDVDILLAYDIGESLIILATVNTLSYKSHSLEGS